MPSAGAGGAGDAGAEAAVLPAAQLQGPLAFPRRNGEPVFSAPWQSRAFGMVLALHQAGALPWEDFRQRLIAATSAYDGDAPEGDGSRYYEARTSAFADLLDARGIVAPGELALRQDAFLRGARREVAWPADDD